MELENMNTFEISEKLMRGQLTREEKEGLIYLFEERGIFPEKISYILRRTFPKKYGELSK